MSKEAMTLALEAVKELHSTGDTQLFDMVYAKPVIKALEEALAKQEGQSNFCPNCEALSRELKAIKQEQGKPVAWMNGWGDLFKNPDDAERGQTMQPLYTTPQPAQKPLTDEQIYDMYNEPRSDAEMLAFARAIEAAHGIKEST